jgi:hypothetical protein
MKVDGVRIDQEAYSSDSIAEITGTHARGPKKGAAVNIFDPQRYGFMPKVGEEILVRCRKDRIAGGLSVESIIAVERLPAKR